MLESAFIQPITLRFAREGVVDHVKAAVAGMIPDKGEE
jgi:hypothetical protein